MADPDRIDRETCRYVVGRYLAGQGWGLAEPRHLADEIWHELGSQASVQQIETAAWQRYAERLHDACRGPEGERAARAWSELRLWLEGQAFRTSDHHQDREDLVQETLLSVQQTLQARPLRVPRTLWAFLLQTMRRQQVDRHRRRTAAKRGADRVQSLDAQAGDEQSWQEVVPAAGDQDIRETEQQVASSDQRAQLQQFFREHLTPLQQQVAEASFLDNLSPAECAGLLGKSPHEVRMLKARLLKRLRSLPPEQERRLRAIIAPHGGEGDTNE